MIEEQTTEQTKGETYEGWSVLELMGHRRLGGYVREVELAGHGLIRIDIPGEGGETFVTQYYSPSALYCLTPATEDAAREVARYNRPAPVARLALAEPDLSSRRATARYDDDEYAGYRY